MCLFRKRHKYCIDYRVDSGCFYCISRIYIKATDKTKAINKLAKQERAYQVTVLKIEER